MLDHAVLLVYASESDWADHQEPLDDVVLCAESVVETARERGEVSVVCQVERVIRGCGAGRA